jgi:hypothetical protein
MDAKTLTIDDVKPSVVFDAYAAGEGFFSGDGKKDQFPDAFIFECLVTEASKKTPVIIVSNDGDFDHPTAAADHVSVVKSLPDLFAALGLEIKAPAVDAFLKNHNDKLVEMVGSELSDWGLRSDDVMDAEIDEITVQSVTIASLTSFKSIEKGGPILVVGRADVQVHLSYTHPNWDEAMYDSEDKVLIPFEDVDGETEVELSIDISMSITVDESGKPEEIDTLSFRNSDFQDVTLYPPEIYK